MNELLAMQESPSTDFQINVPRRLVQEVPKEIRDEPDQLEVYLIQALEIGLKAMAQAGIHLDTDFVKAEFTHFTKSLTSMREGLEELMASELTAEDSKLAKCLRDYLANDGRLDRTVRSLASELGDPKREGSIPGRIRVLLDQNFQGADSPFQRALNCSDDSSPLKKFVSAQDKTLNTLREDLTAKHTALSTSIESSFSKIFDHIGYKANLAEAEGAGTRKGGTFEDQLVEFLQAVSVNKDYAERIGEVSVDGTRVKRGDVLIHVGQDGFDPASIVVEAKRGFYSLGGKDGLLKQLSDAIAYRDAAAGIAVVTKEHAGKRQKTFDRVGNNRIVVIVDPEGENGGMLPLEVAYAVLREAVLAANRDEVSSGPDLAAAESTISQIQNSLGVVTSMKRNCTEATKNIDSVRGGIESMESDIREKVRTLRLQLGLTGCPLP